MKKSTKTILTVAIIAIFVVVAVVIILLFNDAEGRKGSSLSESLPPWSVESEFENANSVASDHSSDIISGVESQAELTIDQRFVENWNETAVLCQKEAFSINAYEKIQPRMILTQMPKEGAVAVIDFTYDTTLGLTVVGANSKEEISALAEIAYVAVTGDTDNNTVEILVSSQDEVKVVIEGYEFYASCNETDGQYSAELRVTNGTYSFVAEE